MRIKDAKQLLADAVGDEDPVIPRALLGELKLADIPGRHERRCHE
jgi:hypothetical protein